MKSKRDYNEHRHSFHQLGGGDKQRHQKHQGSVPEPKPNSFMKCWTLIHVGHQTCL